MARLSVELTPEQNRRIEELAKEMGLSKSDLIRRCVQLMMQVRANAGEGGTVRVTDAEGQDRFVQPIGMLGKI